MGYTCTIHTDFIDTAKTEEILQRVTKIISEAIKNAPSGTAIPSGANKINQSEYITERCETQ